MTVGVSPDDSGREDWLNTLASRRLGINPGKLKSRYDSCLEVSTNPTYGSSTASSGSVSAVAAANAIGMRQCRTAAGNNSKAVLSLSGVMGSFGDASPVYAFARFYVGSINTLNGAGVAPAADTVLAFGFGDSAAFAADSLFFGIFGASSTTNWSFAKFASGTPTYVDTGVAHDIAAPAEHEAHIWRKADGAIYYQLDSGSETLVAAAGAPSTGFRYPMLGALNGAADANARAFKVHELYWAGGLP